MKNDYLIRRREGHELRDDGNVVDWNDSKISFITNRCKGKTVLDLGCVQHDPDFAKNKKWLHKAIRAVASEVTGLDIDDIGVEALRKMGYDNLVVADAQNFNLEHIFDVVVAGDIIEHLHNVGGFLESCRKHMNGDSILIIATPNPWHWHKWIRAFIREVPVNGEHTLWMCPVTLKQVAARFDLEVVETVYGSQRIKDSFMPIPRRVKHANLYSVLRIRSFEKERS